MDDETTVTILFTAADADGSLTTTQKRCNFTAMEGTHTYHITVTDNALNTQTMDVTIKQDTVKPTQPTLAVTTQPTDTTIALTASGSTDSTSGIKEYTLTEANSKIASQTNNTGVFELTGLIAKTEYSFTVTVKDNAGNISDASTALNVMTLKSTQAAFAIIDKPVTVTYADSFKLETEGGSGNGTVTWQVTTGSEYATVDDEGNVTITGVGTVKITATKAGDDSYTGRQSRRQTIKANKCSLYLHQAFRCESSNRMVVG